MESIKLKKNEINCILSYSAGAFRRIKLKDKYRVGEIYWVKEKFAIEYGVKDHTGCDPDRIMFKADKSTYLVDRYNDYKIGDLINRDELDEYFIENAEWEKAKYLKEPLSRLKVKIEAINVHNNSYEISLLQQV